MYVSGIAWLSAGRAMAAKRFLSLSSQCIRHSSGWQNSWFSKVGIQFSALISGMWFRIRIPNADPDPGV